MPSAWMRTRLKSCEKRDSKSDRTDEGRGTPGLRSTAPTDAGTRDGEPPLLLRASDKAEPSGFGTVFTEQRQGSAGPALQPHEPFEG